MPGNLSSLQWFESPLRYTSPCCRTASDQILCDVYFAPLNFCDVVVASGKLQPNTEHAKLASLYCTFGLEISGRDRQGRRVMGIAPSQGIATVAFVDRLFLWEVPQSWTLEEASTVPVAYATAYYALLVRGNMKHGESLLVHAGSGAVGQAAMGIAFSMGCSVFTTVGSKEEREFLKRRFPQLDDRHFSNSRDLSFEEHVLTETRGKGVDLVLNSLAEDKLEASVRCLAPHGRFLEIGRFDSARNSALGMSVFLKNVTFHGVLLDRMLADDPCVEADKRQVAQLVRDGIASGTVRPLESIRFGRDQVEEAFRSMASGKRVGKVVIQIRPEEAERGTVVAPPLKIEAVARPCFYEHKSYVIVGGLDDFGLELAEWMVTRGCRKLLLTSQSGVCTSYQKLCLHRWRSFGVTVVTSEADASSSNGARQVVQQAASMGPVGGIFNVTTVHHDAPIENQTAETFETACKSKVAVTQRLDVLSREACSELDHFVVFSSVASGRGSAGRTNCGYANSAVERICERRVADGLPGHLGLPERHGKIRDLSRFDAQFFSAHPKQAHVMDPQLRLLLETSYEAIVDAGYDPAQFRGRKVGVFVGASNSDSGDAFKVDPSKTDGYSTLGCCRAMFSNRISYALDLHGTLFIIIMLGC
ncbi:hypothetical protein V5799_011045 [Amblyomma americanum]|uniref:Fatty acid synthase n=1 Tax=Amblyomma americanum TaxID=6943 RepID=A0AAQ4EI80_AMBAM